MSKFLDTGAAAAYLGFKTRAGIRHLVYRGELVPDGRGYHGGYVFTEETLDGWIKIRQDRIDGERRRHQAANQNNMGGQGQAAGGANRTSGEQEGDDHGNTIGRAKSPRRNTRRARVNATQSTEDSAARIRRVMARASR